MKNRKRHWYHCTTKWHGQAWTAQRRPPAMQIELIDEPATPRLCVCPTIAACFIARLFAPGQDVIVYRTTRPRSGVRPKGVDDAPITGERWLVPPVGLTFDQVVPDRVARRIVEPQFDRMLQDVPYGDPRPLTALERMQFYADVIELLRDAGVPVWRWEERFVERAIDYMNQPRKERRANAATEPVPPTPRP